MISAQFIAVTTKEIGPAGPVTKLFAAGFETAEEALVVVAAKLKPGETARWLDQRSLAIPLVRFEPPSAPFITVAKAYLT